MDRHDYAAAAAAAAAFAQQQAAAAQQQFGFQQFQGGPPPPSAQPFLPHHPSMQFPSTYHQQLHHHGHLPYQQHIPPPPPLAPSPPPIAPHILPPQPFFNPWDAPPPPVPPPVDADLQKRIDKLAEYAAKNGPDFEKMIREKQQDNPAYNFLFGAEGHGYYRYKLWLCTRPITANFSHGMGSMNPALTSMGSLNSPLQTLNPPLNPGLSSALNPALSNSLLGAAPPLHHSGPFPAFYDQHPQPPPQHSQPLYSQSRSDYEPMTRSFKGLSGPLPSDVAAELYNVLNNLTRTKESIKGVKTWFLLLFTSVPIGLLWLNVEGVLVHLGQDTAISKVAGTYLLFLLPDLVTTSLLEPLRIYLRSQCITKPMMTCSAIAVALHVPINIFLRRLGVKGAALAICWSDFNVVLLLVAWASCLMTCLEWWSYETCVAEDGSHGTVDLGDLYAEEDRYIPPDLKLPAVKSASNLVNLISDRCFHKEPVSQQDFNSREQSFSASFSTVGCDTAVCSKLNAYDCQGGDCVYEMHTEPVEPQEIYGRSVELLLEISVERKQTVFANEFSKRSQVAGLDQAAFVLQNILVELQLFSYQVQNKLAALMMKMDMPLDLPLGEGAGTLSITTQLGTQTGRRSSHCMVDRASEFSGTLEFGPESVPVEIDSG